MAKLCLGTVQIGQLYGYYKRMVMRSTKEPTNNEAFGILQTAEPFIDYYDTAAAYGKAEIRIGKYGLKNKKIITKILPKTLLANPDIEEQIKISGGKLGQLPHGVLFHTPEYIYEKQLVKGLIKAKEKGLVEKIGVSVYEVHHGMDAVRINDFDYIQIPYSVLDQRFDTCDFFELAKENEITVFARSAFLQGLLLAPINKIPKYLAFAKPYVHLFMEIARQYNFTPIQAALLFSLTHPHIDFTVFGVDDSKQLEEDIAIGKKHWAFSDCKKELKKSFLKIPRAVIFPSLWEERRKKNEE